MNRNDGDWSTAVKAADGRADAAGAAPRFRCDPRRRRQGAAGAMGGTRHRRQGAVADDDGRRRLGRRAAGSFRCTTAPMDVVRRCAARRPSAPSSIAWRGRPAGIGRTTGALHRRRNGRILSEVAARLRTRPITIIVRHPPCVFRCAPVGPAMTDDERSQALPARAVEHLERGASRRAADAGQDARTGDERDVVLAAAEEKPWRVNDLLRAIGVAEWRTLSDDDRARRADGVRRTPPLRSDHAATPRRRRRIVRRAHRRGAPRPPSPISAASAPQTVVLARALATVGRGGGRRPRDAHACRRVNRRACRHARRRRHAASVRRPARLDGCGRPTVRRRAGGFGRRGATRYGAEGPSPGVRTPGDGPSA